MLALKNRRFLQLATSCKSFPYKIAESTSFRCVFFDTITVFIQIQTTCVHVPLDIGKFFFSSKKKIRMSMSCLHFPSINKAGNNNTSKIFLNAAVFSLQYYHCITRYTSSADRVQGFHRHPTENERRLSGG